jgi:hypothetical protein
MGLDWPDGGNSDLAIRCGLNLNAGSSGEKFVFHEISTISLNAR